MQIDNSGNETLTCERKVFRSQTPESWDNTRRCPKLMPYLGSIDNQMEPQMSDRVLKLPATLSVTGLGRTSMYDAMKANKFPQPVMLGKRAVGWRESDLIAWIESRPKRAPAK